MVLDREILAAHARIPERRIVARRRTTTAVERGDRGRQRELRRPQDGGNARLVAPVPLRRVEEVMHRLGKPAIWAERLQAEGLLRRAPPIARGVARGDPRAVVVKRSGP